MAMEITSQSSADSLLRREFDREDRIQRFDCCRIGSEGGTSWQEFTDCFHEMKVEPNRAAFAAPRDGGGVSTHLLQGPLPSAVARADEAVAKPFQSPNHRRFPRSVWPKQQIYPSGTQFHRGIF